MWFPPQTPYYHGYHRRHSRGKAARPKTLPLPIRGCFSTPPPLLQSLVFEDRSLDRHMTTPADQQRRLIIEQFTKQAIPFAEMPHHNDEDTNRLVIETAGIGSNDTVLDVACGPGLITTATARVARQVTGIDITPAMIDQARKRQQKMGLTNLAWLVGDVLPLPFADASFSASSPDIRSTISLTPRRCLLRWCGSASQAAA